MFGLRTAKFSKLLTIAWKPFADRTPAQAQTMAARNRRVFEFGSQFDDSQSYGYGGGGGSCPQMNVALHGDRRMPAADHEDEETWAPCVPNMTVVIQQRMDAQGGPVTPAREGRSPTSSESCSPVLGYGLGVRTSSLLTKSATSSAAYSSAGSTLAVSSATPTNVSRTVAAPAPVHEIPTSQQSRVKGGRLPGLDKEGSDTINVIVLQSILAENGMVCAFLGYKSGSKMKKKEAIKRLMDGLQKHGNPVVRALRESALNKRIHKRCARRLGAAITCRKVVACT